MPLLCPYPSFICATQLAGSCSGPSSFKKLKRNKVGKRNLFQKELFPVLQSHMHIFKNVYFKIKYYLAFPNLVLPPLLQFQISVLSVSILLVEQERTGGSLFNPNHSGRNLFWPSLNPAHIPPPPPPPGWMLRELREGDTIAAVSSPSKQTSLLRSSDADRGSEEH